MLTHHGAHGKLKLFHLEDGGFNHQRDYKKITLYQQNWEVIKTSIQNNIRWLLANTQFC
ncbi:MAG: hypothetical protein O7C60_09060 [Rickettsia endosymbiont of Ixodes persulcatus]|nr:hypothetical protein [Rickettsia endosymbiont of Ixodes persulcatus]